MIINIGVWFALRPLRMLHFIFVCLDKRPDFDIMPVDAKPDSFLKTRKLS